MFGWLERKLGRPVVSLKKRMWTEMAVVNKRMNHPCKLGRGAGPEVWH